MKRVVEKVKDIVEICPFTHLHDFAADPGLTLGGYHFTDITVDLMAKWIDRVASVRTGQGAALALAGFRGVGKSHFMAVVAAIVSRPELRSRIADLHVASTAERLSRRHGMVAFVRRGSGTSLHDELKRSIGLVLDVNPGTLSDSLYDLLLRAAEHAGDLPLVLLIDTALGRDSRVARDDGQFLSEIAEASKTLGIFVGVALDDDISGADGANAAISSNFSIDYLDQEHLYKIVDTHIFSKHSQMRPLLHDIYEDYRASLPGFRWSEQRFTSLYPLHPATVEIAPLIRLYIHDFALLGFAADAGVKILGRPANSLIGIDEVFDSVEAKLRLVPEMAEAFAAFERLDREVIAKTPVEFRHPAKLILKGLLTLSLSGEGTTAEEIGASMMIFGGDSPNAESLDISALLDSFVVALPTSIDKVSREGSEPKYCFKLTTRVDGDGILSAAVTRVSEEVVWDVLQNQTAEKYADLEVLGDLGKYSTACNVEWRGATRRGELIWPSSDETEPSRETKEQPDWTIRIGPDDVEPVPRPEENSIAWHLARLSADEKDVIRRHHLLHNDPDIREQFGDGLSKAVHLHSIAVEKIWQRVFLQDGSLSCGELRFKFTEEARAAHGLSQLFTIMLEPLFELQYPAHPSFEQHLGMKQAANLISNFFSGSNVNNAEVQTLAECFAVPLGLAVRHGDIFVPASANALTELDVVRSAFDRARTDGVTPLAELSRNLQAPPMGLTREAVHLILAALVAQRQYEFVTSSGNRISHRSLDLQIIWDDIVGIAKPLNELYTPARLLLWAKLITGNAGIKSIGGPEDRLLITDSLSGWLTGWKQSRTIDDFDALPDESINSAIWRTAANLRKSFGAMADSIEALIKNDLSLDECLQLIADLFSDSEAEFEKKKNDLRVLREFTAGVSRRAEIATFLSLCEITSDPEIERSRLELLDAIRSRRFGALAAENGDVDAIWTDFRKLYSRHYGEKHDFVMRAADSGEKLREIIRSDQWCLFESFSTVSWLDRRYFSKAKSLIRDIRQTYCEAKVSDLLASKPFCSCSFSLADTERIAGLPGQLTITVSSGLESYRKSFTENGKNLIASADTDAMRTSIKSILSGIAQNSTFPSLSGQDIRILRLAAEKLGEDGFAGAATETDSTEELQLDEPDNIAMWQREVDEVEAYVNTDR